MSIGANCVAEIRSYGKDFFFPFFFFLFASSSCGRFSETLPIAFCARRLIAPSNFLLPARSSSANTYIVATGEVVVRRPRGGGVGAKAAFRIRVCRSAASSHVTISMQMASLPRTAELPSLLSRRLASSEGFDDVIAFRLAESQTAANRYACEICMRMAATRTLSTAARCMPMSA